MNISGVRVRFAPSPTGFFHIGSARTALFTWLYARHTGGTFVLRIEDTDKARNSDPFLQVIFDSLRWLGMDWDEGPQKSGPYEPYFQSQRVSTYKHYIERLKSTGRTYEQDGALYFKVSGEPQVIKDIVRGEVTRLEDKDFVVVRSNGEPVFHLVNVIDDIDMKITHVIRGEDHLSNTSKHVELFKAFEAPIPVFAHIPLILKLEGSGKMSKRDKGALLEEYRSRHYLPEAVCNYLCLLGWSPKEDREILPMTEIIQLFDLPAISKNNARFDEKKMAFINGVYVRALPSKQLIAYAKPILLNAGVVAADVLEDTYLANVLSICQEKLRSLEELPGVVHYFFNDPVKPNVKLIDKLLNKGDPKARLKELYVALMNHESFTYEALEILVNELAHTHVMTTTAYIQPARLAISGIDVGPKFYGMLQVLGKSTVLKRIQSFIEML